MSERKWVSGNDRLSLEGYPIWIEKASAATENYWSLHVEQRAPVNYMTLAMAKSDGGNRADELDEFGGRE